MGQFEPGSPISRLGREPDWQAMVIDHLIKHPTEPHERIATQSELKFCC